MAMRVLNNDSVQEVEDHIARYPEGRQRSALLAALHIAQIQIGWVTREAMEDVAELLELDVDQVEEVASFYTMYYTEPVGTYILEVCKTAPCAYMGADEIIEYLSDRLGIEPGQTTADGMFTLFRVECLAACHRAPMMQVNHRYMQDLTPEKIDAFLDAARERQLRVSGAPGFVIRKTWSESVEPVSS